MMLFGTKLSQEYDGPGDPIVFDYVGDFVYINDTLHMIQTIRGRILPSDCKNLIVNRDANSLSGFEADPNDTDVDVELYHGVADNYVKVTANVTTSDVGVLPIGGTFSVKGGENYLFKVQGYQATGTSAELYVWSNDGDLVSGGTPLPIGSGNEAIVSVPFEIHEGVTSVKVGVRWSNPSVNDAFYINRVALYQTDWEYQYFLKDNQGNTRVVLQTTPAVNTYVATMETENVASESYDEIETGFLETFPAANHTQGGNEALKMDDTYRLAATKSVQVFPGDEIDISVYAYYENSSGHTQGANTIIAALVADALSGGATAVSGEAITGAYNSGEELLFGLAPEVDSDKPAAFLNYILFNEDYLPVEGKSVPVGDDPFTLTKISLPTIKAKSVGFLYVYLSYEDESDLGVFFDDLTIEHTESAVVQVNAYYPYGSIAYAWMRDGEAENRFLWQGKEYDANAGWYDFHARQYDGAIGRFLSIDSKGQFASGYVGMGNSPVMGVDPDGEWVHLLIGAVIGGVVNWATHGAKFNAQGLKYFGVGALAGALAAGIGVGVNVALAGGSFGAGFAGTATGVASTGFISGAATGASAGFTNGLISGTGNSLITGNSFGSSLGSGLKAGAIQGLIGGVTGGIGGGLHARAEDLNFWNGTAELNLSEGVGAHGFIPDDDVVVGKYVGKFEGTNVYETPELGTGYGSGGITLPGRGITVGKGVFTRSLDFELMQHEFGHVLQINQLGGYGFLKDVGLPSIRSANQQGVNGWSHNKFWTEVWANNLSNSYFEANYGFLSRPWNYVRFPLTYRSESDHLKGLELIRKLYD